MTVMSRTRTPLARAALLAALAVPAFAQPAADGPIADVDALLKQARVEIAEFEKAGGRRDDPRHPVAGWVEKLLAFRAEHKDTRAAGKALAEALHLLIHADRIPEMETRADGLAGDDPAWEFLPGYLSEAAGIKKDYAFVVRRLEAVLAQQRLPKTRASVHYQLGRGQAKLGDVEAARKALKAAIQEAAGSPLQKEALTALYEVENLGYGQPAPAFSGQARDGSRVALADYRGRSVLLVFWAST